MLSSEASFCSHPPRTHRHPMGMLWMHFCQLLCLRVDLLSMNLPNLFLNLMILPQQSPLATSSREVHQCLFNVYELKFKRTSKQTAGVTSSLRHQHVGHLHAGCWGSCCSPWWGSVVHLQAPQAKWEALRLWLSSPLSSCVTPGLLRDLWCHKAPCIHRVSSWAPHQQIPEIPVQFPNMVAVHVALWAPVAGSPLIIRKSQAWGLHGVDI